MVDLALVADEIRETVIGMAKSAGSGHVSSALSEIDILTTLYLGGVLEIDPSNMKWEERDRFVLSKGHGAIGLYVVLNKVGIISKDLLDSYGTNGSTLCPHCDSIVPGVEVSTGSLGHGLPIAVGIAEAARLKGNKYLIYCLLGDSELYEGSNWEAAMYASSRKLSNLICIVDRNKQGSMGFIEIEDKIVTDLPSQGSLHDKFSAFGFDVYEVDGHNIDDLIKVFNTIKFSTRENPTTVIASTIKGKGCIAMENKRFWHGRVP